MTIAESLKVFNIGTLDNETPDSIKSKYRKLMKSNHPDNRKSGYNTIDASDINEAYIILKDVVSKLVVLKQLESRASTKKTIILQFADLINIYSGKYPTVKGSIVNKTALSQENILLVIDCQIQYNGVDNTFTTIEKYNIDDNYVINCDIKVTSLENDDTIKIKVLDKEKEIKLTHQSTSIVLNLDFNIRLKVSISKKIITEDT